MLRKFALLISMTVAMMPPAIRADGPAVAATHVWIREAPSDTTAKTGYLILENLSSQTLTLVNVSSPDFDSVVIRRGSLNENKIQPVSSISIPAHTNFTFSSDNYYLMLTKPAKQMYEGDLVTLALTFSDHSSLTIMAPVRRDQPAN